MPSRSQAKKTSFRTTLFAKGFLWYQTSTLFIKSRPFLSFSLTLIFLFAVIFIGNALSSPKVKHIPALPPVSVSLYTIGQVPRAQFQAKVDKKGVVKIVALGSGVVQGIFVSEGDSVAKGQQLLSLSTNYQGGNAPSLQAQIAADQYAEAASTFDEQKDAISKQRNIANAVHDNFSDQQSIATQSASDTSSLMSQNQVILDQLNQQLSQSQAAGATPSALIPLESQITQLQGAQNQLRSTLSNLNEQTDSTKPQGRLADAQRDLNLKQLDIQEKTLDVNLEISKLQAAMTEVSAEAMLPTSPFAGTVQRVYVRTGQNVSSGTPLLEVSAANTIASAIVDVPEEIAKKISPVEDSFLIVNTTSYTLRPAFIPTEATNGPLFSIVFPLPETLTDKLSDGEYVSLSIPVGYSDTSAAVPFIPLDAIYQTQDSTYVLLYQSGKAIVKKVTVGNVLGDFAEVMSGLSSGNQVILNRNVIAGDNVQPE